MRRVFRLVRPDYAPGLDGLGARRDGGRWNSAGRAAVYCASSVSLAAMEVFVHLPPSMRTPDKLPKLMLVMLDIPDGLPGIAVDMADVPAPQGIHDYRAIGDRWLAAGHAVWMDVPSLVIPYERNLVLNPNHPNMGSVVVSAVVPFVYDQRMGH